MGGIYSIDPDLPNWSATYKPIIDKLKDAGYKENEDLFGAPYDFRLAGDGLASVSAATELDGHCQETLSQITQL